MTTQLFRPSYEVEECLEAIRHVLESGWTGAGPECKKFEENWLAYSGAKHGHFIHSATGALHIASRCLDLAARSPVLTTPLTFLSTNAVILYENYKPIFVDINEHDLSLDAEDFLLKREETKANAALWVHYGGSVSPHFYKVMAEIPNSFQLIEDCAHASGASYSDGKRVGSREDTVACFSFQAVKNLPTFDGGLISSSSHDYISRCRRLAWLGIDKDTFNRTDSDQKELYKWKYDVPELGWKYNGNDISAAIANVQLKYLDRDNLYRKEIYNRYFNNFHSSTRVSIVNHSPFSSHHLVVLKVKNRDEVINALKKAGVSPGVHYLPNYEFPVFKPFYRKGQCPNAERLSNEIISLPNHLKISMTDVDRISEVVENAARD